MGAGGAEGLSVGYLEGGEVEQGETVEETDALQSHLDDPGAVWLLALGGGLRHEAVQQDAVQRVHHSHQLGGLQQSRQSGRVLAFIVKYTGSAGEQTSGRSVKQSSSTVIIIITIIIITAKARETLMRQDDILQ